MKPFLKLISILLLFLYGNSTKAQIPNSLTLSEKIYGLSKFWQEVNYNFVYLNKIDKSEWDKAYQKAIEEITKTKNDFEYFRTLQKFCALLKDGHTNVYMPDSIYYLLQRTDFGKYRLFVSNIDGKAIITRTNKSIRDEIPIGTEIIEVNDLKTSEYLDQFVKPYISSSTDYILQNLAVRDLFLSMPGTQYNIKLRLPDGTIKAMKLTHSKTTEKEVYPELNSEGNKLLSFRWLENEIAYVALNSFDDPKINLLFERHIQELSKAKRIIIDLRNNDGGNSLYGMNILRHFCNDTILYGARSYSRLHIPAYKAWGQWVREKDTTNNGWAKQAYLTYKDDYYHSFPYVGDTIKDEISRIIVPIVILIGNKTASAAEDFLIYAHTQKHMTKIGEATFGSTGQPYGFKLPGGGEARVCTKKDTYPDGKEFVGVGIQPDILVQYKLEDYLSQNDRVLDVAIDYLKGK